MSRADHPVAPASDRAGAFMTGMRTDRISGLTALQASKSGLYPFVRYFRPCFCPTVKRDGKPILSANPCSKTLVSEPDVSAVEGIFKSDFVIPFIPLRT